MADIDPTDFKKLLDEFSEQNRRNSAAPSGNPPQSSSEGAKSADLNPVIDILKSIASAVSGIAGWLSQKSGVDNERLAGMKEAGTGLLAFKNSTYAATGAIDELAKKVPLIGELIKHTGIDLNNLIQTAQAGNKQGLGQGDPFELEKQARQAGFKDANALLEFFKSNYSNNTRTIGRTANEAMLRFSDFAVKTQETDLGKRLIGQNKYTADDLAKISFMAAGGNTDALRDAASRKELAEKTAVLAAKIDAQSQATGESRDAIIKDMIDRQNSTKAQLEMQALSNDQERQNYLKNQVLFSGMGKDMQDVAGTIQAGGRLSKQQRATLQAATGGRGGQFIQLMREQRRTAGLADTDPMKIAANKALSDFIAGMNDYQKSQLFAQQAITTGNEGIRTAAFNAAEQNKLAAGQQAIARESNLTPEQARDRQQKGYGLSNLRGERQETLLQGPGRQEPVYGAELFKELNIQNDQLRKNAAGAAGGLGKLNEQLVKNTDIVNDVRKAGEAILGKPRSQEETTRRASEGLDEFVNKFITSTNGSTRPSGIDARGNIITDNVVIAKPANVTIQSPETNKPETKPVTAPVAKPEGERASGTLGETGQTTEPKDAIVKIHKGESVLTPEQRNSMLKDSANAAIDKLLGKSNPRDPENQDVRYKNVDPNAPEFVKMRQDNEAERAERAKYMRTREVADPLYAGGKRFETYDIREEEAKQKEAAAKIAPLVKSEVPQVEIPQEQANQSNNMYASLRDFAKQRKDSKTSQGASDVNKAVIGMLTEIQSKMGITSTAINAIKGKASSATNIAQEFKDYQPKTPAVPTPPIIPDKTVDNKVVPKETVTLKDLNDQLIQLNSNIKQLVNHGSATVQYAEQQIKATKGLSGNRFA